MEVHFPHLTNGVAVERPSKTQRIKLASGILFSAGLCCALALSVSYAFASTMNQEMIAHQEKLQVEMCYELKKDINGFMFINLHGDKVMSEGYAKYLESLTTSFSNFCKR